MGAEGDWNHYSGHPTADVNKGTFYNNFYDELKNQLEQKGGPQVKELNQKMSDIIPIERAAMRRNLVASRNNPISFDDFIGLLGSAVSGNLGTATVTLGNMATKSPNVAGGVYKLGQLSGKLGNFLGER